MFGGSGLPKSNVPALKLSTQRNHNLSDPQLPSQNPSPEGTFHRKPRSWWHDKDGSNNRGRGSIRLLPSETALPEPLGSRYSPWDRISFHSGQRVLGVTKSWKWFKHAQTAFNSIQQLYTCLVPTWTELQRNCDGNWRKLEWQQTPKTNRIDFGCTSSSFSHVIGTVKVNTLLGAKYTLSRSAWWHAKQILPLEEPPKKSTVYVCSGCVCVLGGDLFIPKKFTGSPDRGSLHLTQSVWPVVKPSRPDSNARCTCRPQFLRRQTRPILTSENKPRLNSWVSSSLKRAT